MGEEELSYLDIWNRYQKIYTVDDFILIAISGNDSSVFFWAKELNKSSVFQILLCILNF